jgi:hypothetical protein
MKKVFLFMSGFQFAARGLLVGFALLLCNSAAAQNLLGNPSFESPLAAGATNWTIHYVHGSPDDFTIKDRTTSADRRRAQQANTRGLHFRPSTSKMSHAYASQTLSGLQVGHTYHVSSWIGCESRDFGNAPTTYRVYFEAIGGLGPVRSPDAPNVPGDANQPPSGESYTIDQTPDASGKIEIRLHFEKFRFCTYDKLVLINGYFDDLSVTY